MSDSGLLGSVEVPDSLEDEIAFVATDENDEARGLSMTSKDTVCLYDVP